ncbi:MAG: gluconeogenesis factor YvcK family protein [Chloroflexota bacterium]
MFERSTLKWLSIGIGVKRWLLVLFLGNILIAVGFALMLIDGGVLEAAPVELTPWAVAPLVVVAGVACIFLALSKLSRNILAPYRRYQQGRVIDVVYAHSRRQKGIRVVAIGGGTGLPSVLRGLKAYTSNITAVVTVADDGGSSGRLRRELGVLPPGDIRNNIAALADDESLITQLFQYRFDDGDLGGHAFGNLFIAALAGISGGLETALPEVERVLNIQGRVLPSTLEDVNLVATIRLPDRPHLITVRGESKIDGSSGRIEAVSLSPANAEAYPPSLEAIREADIVVIGPGSLYTSILPNLMIDGVAKALRESSAHKVYVCNVATQPEETEGFNVADHVLAIEAHIGRGLFQTVLANDATPPANKNTHYVALVPPGHEVAQRYTLQYTDLTDPEQPWRHDPKKLAAALLKLLDSEKMGSSGIRTTADSISINASPN